MIDNPKLPLAHAGILCYNEGQKKLIRVSRIEAVTKEA